MYLIQCDTTARKADIRDHLMILAADAGQPLSKARADKLADKFKRGTFDPALVRIIGWSDPTGETACNNVMREAVAA
jgi:hypothetical protein